ncbi:MAG TPA: CYTH domain-containing protein [Xanthobacteraceae bacterium]|jgi:inorganic triphosphatase YgiF
MDNEPKEIELKLRIDPQDIAALRNHPRFAMVLPEPIRETLNSIYFDTDNRFLYKHGLTLRVSQIGERRIQTVKTATSAFLERSEWEQAIESDQPDLARWRESALGPLLTYDVRNALQPIFETRINRRSYGLNENGTEILLAIDEGQIIATGSYCPICEIELELKRGNPRELFKIAREIVSSVPAQLDVKSKPERG